LSLDHARLGRTGRCARSTAGYLARACNPPKEAPMERHPDSPELEGDDLFGNPENVDHSIEEDLDAALQDDLDDEDYDY
jgi:hypothetical protein